MKTAVLIPAYNEEKRIAQLIEEVVKSVPDVIVVDDGSTDATADVVAGTRVFLLRQRKNLGKGAALRIGFDYILSKGFDSVLVMDADGQHAPADIPHFIKKALETNAGIILGNRMGKAGNMPLVRRLTNKIMSFILSFIVRQKIPDSQCGYRLIKRKVLETVRLNSSNYEIDSELLLEANKAGFKIDSIPVKTIYGGQKSCINPLVDTLRFFKLIFRFFRVPGKHKYPSP